MVNDNSFPYIYRIARAVHQYITAQPLRIRHLYLQPLNHHIPQRTSWWLVPSQRIPFYQYSKLFFHHIHDYSPRIIAGFSFDRGLGGQLSGLVDSALLMQSDWYWRRFLNDVIARALEEPVQRIVHQSKAKLLLIVELYDFRHMHRRLLETKKPDDTLVFELKDDVLSDLTIRHAAIQQLKPLESAKSCYDLAIRIEMDPDFAWHWLRFTFGVELSENFSNTDKRSVVGLWENILSPWMSLIG